MAEPTNVLDRDHYHCGWNDTEYGLNNWTGSCGVWKNPVEWAAHIKRIAEDCKREARGFHNRAYYDGVIDCVVQYQTTGVVERKRRASFEELNA